jgi:hypothetical protein
MTFARKVSVFDAAPLDYRADPITIWFSFERAGPAGILKKNLDLQGV